MQVNQIATMLNDIYGEIIGEGELIAEDLSNIVSVGQTITGTSMFGDNFDNYVRKIIDKVGLTLYGTKAYRGTAPNIIRYGVPNASVIEKLRVEVGDFTENQAWELTDPSQLDFSDIFDFVPANITSTYYNKKVTFKLKISIPEYQLRSAFNSAAEMVRFIDLIEMRILSKMRMAQDALVKRVIANMIAEKINANNGVINLVTAYNAATGNTVTAATALSDKNFLNFASMTIGVYRDLLKEETGAFNNAGYVTHTDDDTLRMLFMSDFAKALESTLYANTFHEEYVKQSGYSEVGFWQGFGNGTIADRSKLIVKPASNNSTTVTATYVMAVLYDDAACFVAGEHPVTKALPNPDGDFTNFWHKWDAAYYNDMAENALVFVLADPVNTPGSGD